MVTTVAGFQAPESAYWHAPSRSWFVSNVAGSPAEKDGKGWISRLDANGKMTKARWVDGLNAPKGIRINGRTLYVADVDELVVVDTTRAKVKARLKAPGATFLNDVAIGPAGEVYVSDTMTNAIYRCRGDRTCEVFLKTEKLEGPNGLLVEGNRLVVAAWGIITDPATFGTKTPGHLLQVDLGTREITPIGDGQPVGNLDGLEKDGADYLVTDWMAGKLLRISKSGAVTVLKDGFQNSADLGYDPVRRLVAVPEMGAGKVQLLRLDP
jgi:sugar lactone lactonase YvrE